MAKKKNKKTQKPAEWTSPPPSPKQAPEEAHAILTEAPLSPGTTATETTHDDFQSIASPMQPELDDLPSSETFPQPQNDQAGLPSAEIQENVRPTLAPEATTKKEVKADSNSLETVSETETSVAPTTTHPDPNQPSKETSPNVNGKDTEQSIETEPEGNIPCRTSTSKEPGPQPDCTLVCVEPKTAPSTEESVAKTEPVPVESLTPSESTKEESTEVAVVPSPGELESKPRETSSEPSLPPTASIPLPDSTTSTALPSLPKEEVGSPKSQPKPEAIKQVIEESRPPAPTPPISRARPRHTSAFEDDDDDEEALLIQPRMRGDTVSRESSRGLTYPPHTTQSRSFASRVPSEHFSDPPPPPGYHPRYYQSGAPPYYHSHIPSMSHSGYSNQTPYGSSSQGSASYQHESWNQVPPTYNSSPIQRHDSIGSREYLLAPRGTDNNSTIEDDPVERLLRVSQVIPDIPIVLARIKELENQLRIRNELLRRADYELQERMRVKDGEINDLKMKVSELEARVLDSNRLRLEVGNLEDQLNELKEQIAETDKLRNVIDDGEKQRKDLESVIVALEERIIEEQENAQRKFDEWKMDTNTKHNAREVALALTFDRQLKEADERANHERREAAAAFVREKDELRSEYQEREANFAIERKELESKLNIAQKDRDDAQKQERESREIWQAERDGLIKSHIEDRESIRKGFDEQRQLLEATHKKMKEEGDKAWMELHAEANKRAEEERNRGSVLAKERDEFQKKVDDIVTKRHSEKAQLEMLLESYGDITELKSKGDTHYKISFSQLQTQIMDLANTFFTHLPVTPPSEDLVQIPSGFPSFLGDTVASRQLRSAYIAHTVSNIITRRVFSPFLFSLSQGHDKANSLFADMSNHIHKNSARREGLWRQQTLLAAFTSTGAKERINTAAGTVVDELVNAIKNFADPREVEGIKIAVRKVVKLAATVWRETRLETSRITAQMPDLPDNEHGFTGMEFFPAYKPDDTPVPSLISTNAELNEQPKLLLRLFPVISREPKNGNSENREADVGCIYHYGLGLYEDAKSVSTRRGELEAAGLPPPSINISTAADFPEPLNPPPRHPLPSPPTPQVSEENTLPPSSPAEPIDPLHFLVAPPAPEELKNAYTRPIPVPIASPSNEQPIEGHSPNDSTLTPPLPLPPSAPTSTGSETHDSSLPTPPLPNSSPNEVEVPDSSLPLIPPRSPQLSLAENESNNLSLPLSSGDITNSTQVTDPSVSDVSSARGLETTAVPPQFPEPTESAIIPPFLPPLIPTVSHQSVSTGSVASPPVTGSERASSVKTSSRHENPPTPPRSRAATPTSPLFAAVDEIDGLQRHTSTRKPSLSRRSTRSKNSNEELEKGRPESVSRRTSGYTISNKSGNDAASMKSNNSRYTNESRSAAIKALYPNGPLAGQPVLRSSKHRSIESRNENGTWDFSSTSLSSQGVNTEPSTHQ